MLKFLFPRLTADPRRGAKAFAAIAALGRAPALYRQGGVPDTLDGRFAALATVTALALVRLESDGEAGDALSVAVTERFIDAMEAEHRELGMSDPTLGKTVRRLVGSLSRRTDLWRGATGDDARWNAALLSSLYTDSVNVDPAAASAASDTLRHIWQRLESTTVADLEAGELA